MNAGHAVTCFHFRSFFKQCYQIIFRGVLLLMVASAGWGEDHIKGLPDEWMSIGYAPSP